MSSTFDSSPARILIVDDTPANRIAFREVLSGLGEIFLAASGREALRCLLEAEFSVILLDIRMPVMDGIETASIIRRGERARNTPIIFVSAYEKTPLEVAEGRLGGVIDYLFSPVEPDTLRRKVANLIEIYQEHVATKTQLSSALRVNQTLEARIREVEADLAKLREGHPGAGPPRPPTKRSYRNL